MKIQLNPISSTASLLVGGGLLFGLLFLSIISLSGSTIHYSHQSVQLAKQQQSLLQQQQILTEQLANQQSIAAVTEFAQKSAMVPIAHTTALDVNVALAQVPSPVVVQ
jgi:hypothetical protein